MHVSFDHNCLHLTCTLNHTYAMNPTPENTMYENLNDCVEKCSQQNWLCSVMVRAITLIQLNSFILINMFS